MIYVASYMGLAKHLQTVVYTADQVLVGGLGGSYREDGLYSVSSQKGLCESLLIDGNNSYLCVIPSIIHA